MAAKKAKTTPKAGPTRAARTVPKSQATRKPERPESWVARVPPLRPGTYADGMPIHEVQYLCCKLILRPNHFVTASFVYDTPHAHDQREETEAVVTYTLDRAAMGKADAFVMQLVDQVSIAKMQIAEAAAAAGNVEKATRLLGHAISGTQRLGNTKATQALVSLQNEVKKTQTLTSRSAKTQLLTAQASLRKTQLLDPDSIKDTPPE